MPQGLGYSFQPGDATRYGAGSGQEGPKGASPQDVAKIVSLRMPHRTSPTAVAPQALLQSKGLAGGAGLDQLVMALMRALGPQNLGPGSGPTGPLPPPRITPPVEDPSAIGGPSFINPSTPDWQSMIPGGGIGNTGRNQNWPNLTPQPIGGYEPPSQDLGGADIFAGPTQPLF